VLSCVSSPTRFVPADDVVGNNLTKSSVQRGFRAKILEQYPTLEEDAETILPKKAPIVLVKWCAPYLRPGDHRQRR